MNTGLVATTLTAFALISLGVLDGESRGDGPAEWTRSVKDGASLLVARRPPWAIRSPGCDAAGRADGPAIVLWISDLFTVVCVEWGSDSMLVNLEA